MKMKLILLLSAMMLFTQNNCADISEDVRGKTTFVTRKHSSSKPNNDGISVGLLAPAGSAGGGGGSSTGATGANGNPGSGNGLVLNAVVVNSDGGVTNDGDIYTNDAIQKNLALVYVHGPVVINTSLEVQSSSSLTVHGNLDIHGDLTVNGTLNVYGTLTVLGGDVIFQTINAIHVYGDVIFDGLNVASHSVFIASPNFTVANDFIIQNYLHENQIAVGIYGYLTVHHDMVIQNNTTESTNDTVHLAPISFTVINELLIQNNSQESLDAFGVSKSGGGLIQAFKVILKSNSGLEGVDVVAGWFRGNELYLLYNEGAFLGVGSFVAYADIVTTAIDCNEVNQDISIGLMQNYNNETGPYVWYNFNTGCAAVGIVAVDTLP